MPMRITDRLADLLASYQEPGGREIAIVTHVQHSYELTQDTVDAVQKLRMRGMKVYNQLVYTFFISRRFEAAFLRQQLCRVGIEPYYTFNTKGKDETIEYRVPLARLLQEQKEEARLLPGLTRTDEAVYNVPGLGKNYLRARQHRDLISVLPNGARLYEFHPWEKNIAGDLSTYVHEDVAILDYLQRLDAIGEDVADYDTIWYYF
jgi:lysine 2,3-aminomutase